MSEPKGPPGETSQPILNAIAPITKRIRYSHIASIGNPKGLVNNSNLGVETSAEDVLGSLEYADSVADATGLEIVCTCVNESFYNELKGKIENLFPLKLQGKIN